MVFFHTVALQFVYFFLSLKDKIITKGKFLSLSYVSSLSLSLQGTGRRETLVTRLLQMHSKSVTTLLECNCGLLRRN